MGTFNNREIAIALWLIVFLVMALLRADIRRMLAEIVRAFCHFKILGPVCLMLLYSIAAVMLLCHVGFWKAVLLKDTILWFCMGAMSMMMHFSLSDDSENIFRKVLVDNAKIVIILEFIINAYTFSLLAEIIIIFLLIAIGILDAFASSDKEYAVVAKFIKRIQLIFGLVIITFVLSRVIPDLQSLQSWDNVRSIVLAPLLSVILSPFLYVMVLFSKYEQVFLRLNFGVEKQRNLKGYARRRIIMHAGLSLKRLQRLIKNHAFDLMQIQTEGDVDHLLQSRTVFDP